MKKIVEKTFLEFKFLSDPTYSPDGKNIAFKVSTSDYENNRNLNDLYVIREDKKTYRVTSTGNVGCFTWDGNDRILYVPTGLTGKCGNSCLYRLDPFADAEKQVPQPVCELSGKNVSNLGFLRGRIFYYVCEQLLPKEADPHLTPIGEKEKIYYTFEEIPTFKNNKGVQSGRRNTACIVNVETGENKTVSDPGQHVTSATANEDTVLFASAAYNENGVIDEHVSLSVYELENTSGTAETAAQTAAGAAGKSSPASLAGKLTKVMNAGDLVLRHLEVTGTLWNGKILVLGSKGETYGVMQSPDAWIIDRKTLQMEKLFPFRGTNIAGRTLTTDCRSAAGMMKPAGERLYFTNTRDHYTYLRFFGPDGKWSEDLTPDGTCDAFDIHGENFCYTGFFGNRLSEIYENGVQLTHLNEFVQEEYSISTPEILHFTDTDGYKIDGWVMKPVDYVPGKKYPVILDIHGGPRSVYGEAFFHEHQMWTADGYFVIYCNPRGGEGRDDDFADCWGEKMGVVDYNDIMQFVDVVLEKYPDADEKRMGVMGVSYGGYMTNWIIGHTDRFAAACAACSISNYTSLEYATAGIGYYWAKNFVGYNTKENAAFLWEKSPLKYAPCAKTPTLFIHCNQDNVCWQDQGFQMYTALKIHGCEAKMIYFKHEGHTFGRDGLPVHRLARMEELHSWMDKYLK